MKCPECVAAGTPSRVNLGPSFSTCMGGQNYYDEDGKYHSHDPNWTSTECRCSNGHSWTEVSQSKCPACDFGRPAETVDE